MCDSDKATTEIGGGDGGVGDRDDERSKRNFGIAKEAVLYPFAKARKHLLRKGKLLSSSSSSGKRRVGVSNSGKGCCFCFRQPNILDPSSVDSISSDPNSPTFSNALAVCGVGRCRTQRKGLRFLIHV